MTEQGLRDLLRMHKVPLHEWGRANAKTVEFLLAEITKGESVLEPRRDGLCRIARGVTLDVFFGEGRKRLKLVEARQMFPDGRERSRGLDTSLGEKMLPDELPADAARRALREELSITAPVPLWYKGRRDKGPVASVSYPGVLTVYQSHHFEAVLGPAEFRAEGYREERPDQVTVFEWEACERNRSA